LEERVEIKMPRNPSKIRCKAKSRTTGEQCRRWSVHGYNVCHYHGANPKNHGGAPKHNQNATKHGAYVNRLLNAEEEAIFREYYEALGRDFELNDAYTRELAEKVCLCYVRLIRAIGGGSAEDIYKIDCLLSGKLAQLKAVMERRKRDSGKMTYDEWKDDLLESFRLINERKKHDGRFLKLIIPNRIPANMTV
jgi:hypothetical protein